MRRLSAKVVVTSTNRVVTVVVADATVAASEVASRNVMAACVVEGDGGADGGATWWGRALRFGVTGMIIEGRLVLVLELVLVVVLVDGVTEDFSGTKVHHDYYFKSFNV
ncbi:hypothetical protein AVEN_273543-1 [Araneus ventricosus]|uniref:Uncharacterized protein n=1 Tax=Araneus ventricosus TaxID=182803 RepID=A0A4Y2KMY1_ARAVE|nr:hypothetical protein AVEN_273543-1 [Araneus ventricosus]